MDKGAWWATVHRVAKSQTWLKWFSMHTLFVDALLEFAVIFKLSICLNYGKKKKKFWPWELFLCVCVCVCVWGSGEGGRGWWCGELRAKIEKSIKYVSGFLLHPYPPPLFLTPSNVSYSTDMDFLSVNDKKKKEICRDRHICIFPKR